MRLRNYKAFSLVEVMLAIAVFSLFVGVFTGAIIYGRESTALSGKRTQAVLLAKEGLEAARNIQDENYENLIDGTHGMQTTGNAWSFSGSSDVTGEFSREVIISSVDENTKEAVCNVSWNQNAQRQGLISLVTRFSNWKKDYLSCNWLDPVANSFDVPSQNDGLKMAVKDDYVFAVFADTGGTDDFHVLDVSNPMTPTLVASLNLIGTPTNIFVIGDYAYVSNTDNVAELKIIDISNPTSPQLVGSYDTNGPSGGQPDANSVFVYGTTAYIVTGGHISLPEFFVVNVSDPTNPTLIGSVDLGGGNSGGNDLFKSGNYIFIVGSDSARELNVVDISNPASPNYLSGSFYNTPGIGGVNVISGVGSLVALGAADGYLYLVDISNPNLISQSSLISSFDVGDNIFDLAIEDSGEKVFVGSNNNVQAEFQVVNISTPNSPYPEGAYEFGLRINGVAFDTKKCAIYVLSSDAVEFYSLTPDQTPPGVVTNLATSNPNYTTVNLSWTAPADDGNVVMSGPVSGYDIRYATSVIDSESKWNAATQISNEPNPATPGTNQTMTVSGLSGGTQYYFALKSFDEIPNVSGLSNSPSATTLIPGDTTPPGQITNLSTSSPTATSITLNWTASADDGYSGSPATGYDIRYATSIIDTEIKWNAATQVSGEPVPGVPGSAQSMIVSGLIPEMTYYFAIKVYDEIPNYSILSNSPSGTTLAGLQADYLVVNTGGTDTNPDTTVVGITIQNTKTTGNIVIAQMSGVWTAITPGPPARLMSITINAGVVWSSPGGATSGSLIDISDFILVSGAGAYPINSMIFNKSMMGGTLSSLSFTMGDGSIKTVTGFPTPLP